jgi:hypothetical protein
MDMNNHSAEGSKSSLNDSRDEGNATSIVPIFQCGIPLVEELPGKKKYCLPSASNGGSAGSKGLFVELETPSAGL